MVTEEIEVGAFHVELMESVPPGDNPFWHDGCRMGVSVDENVTVMYERHQGNDYVILHHKPSGQRILIGMPRGD